MAGRDGQLCRDSGCARWIIDTDMVCAGLQASANSRQHGANPSALEDRAAEVYKRIQNERRMIDGFRAMANATNNPDVRTQIQAKIRDSEKSIQWFEQSLLELQKRRDMAANGDGSFDGRSPPSSQTAYGQQGSSSTSSLQGDAMSSRAPSAMSTAASSAPSSTARNRVLPPTPQDGSVSDYDSPRRSGPSHALSMRKRTNYTHLGAPMSYVTALRRIR